MIRFLSVLAFAGLAACSVPDTPTKRPEGVSIYPEALPAMKMFGPAKVTPPERSNTAMAADILDLTFRLESGRELPVLTRFETPITVRVTGDVPPTLPRDLDQLLARLRNEAGLTISQVPATSAASITIAVITKRELQRAVPQAACFVAPNVTSWAEFRKSRRSQKLDWTRLKTRETMAIFLPGDVAPQEIRDCLHEELAQAIGPLNDLYRLPDSVYNDDNFHTVLTGFDMLVLRTIYDPALRSGMSKAMVAQRLPTILNNQNPAGRGGRGDIAPPSTRPWIDAMEGALGPRSSQEKRINSAARAVSIANQQNWNDTRTGFSYFAHGRLSTAKDAEGALESFLQSGGVYSQTVGTELQTAHVGLQLATFALAANQPDAAIDIVTRHQNVAADAQNAALLSTMLIVKAEAMALQNRFDEARTVMADGLAWGQYGFGGASAIQDHAEDIARLSPRYRKGAGS